MVKNLKAAVLIMSIGMTFPTAAFAKQKYQLTTPYDPAAHEVGDGINMIRGNALIPLQDGNIITCSGKQVSLVPVTPYTTERMLISYNSDREGYRGVRLYPKGPLAGFSKRTQDAVPDFQPEHEHYQRTAGRMTRCDSRGDFEFSRIPDGDYYVTTTITWQYSGYIPDGGALMSRVSLRGGQTARVVLAP